MIKYSKGLTPSAIQHKYKLTYEKGFELATIINNQQAEINRLREAIRLARDTAYQATQDCPRCGFIDDILTKSLNGESEGR